MLNSVLSDNLPISSPPSVSKPAPAQARPAEDGFAKAMKDARESAQSRAQPAETSRAQDKTREPSREASRDDGHDASREPTQDKSAPGSTSNSKRRETDSKAVEKEPAVEQAGEQAKSAEPATDSKLTAGDKPLNADTDKAEAHSEAGEFGQLLAQSVQPEDAKPLNENGKLAGEPVAHKAQQAAVETPGLESVKVLALDSQKVGAQVQTESVTTESAKAGAAVRLQSDFAADSSRQRPMSATSFTASTAQAGPVTVQAESAGDGAEQSLEQGAALKSELMQLGTRSGGELQGQDFAKMLEASRGQFADNRQTIAAGGQATASQTAGQAQASLSSTLQSTLHSTLTAREPAQMASGLQERIAMMAGQKIQHAEIRLDPAELGSMVIRLRMESDQAQLSIVTQHGATRDMIEQSLNSLRHMLGERGIQLADATVSQQSRQDGQAFANQQGASQGEGQGNGQGGTASKDSHGTDGTPDEQLASDELMNAATQVTVGVDYFA